MIIDNPDFKRGSFVLITRGWREGEVATVLKAIKGRDTIRVNVNNYRAPISIHVEHLRVVTTEDNPELFI